MNSVLARAMELGVAAHDRGDVRRSVADPEMREVAARYAGKAWVSVMAAWYRGYDARVCAELAAFDPASKASR